MPSGASAELSQTNGALRDMKTQQKKWAKEGWRRGPRMGLFLVEGGSSDRERLESVCGDEGGAEEGVNL